ncbi:uncharacterized protein ACB058_006994 [Synchiropus picturatus]
MVDPDLPGPHLHVQLRNDSATSLPSTTEDSSAVGNGIIPGTIAAAVFIIFLLSLYAVLWRCMLSPPPRKQKKGQSRVPVKTSV